MKNKYFKNLLGQILAGEQPAIERAINSYLEEGPLFEGRTIYKFENLQIWEAVEFLKENYDELKDLII